ncbi:MAG TPA: M28 family peptidase [Steroidobacteraceae bacterium]|nr:M28 family peptidase [Steroidobacteraceae bacterium]
MRGRGPVGGVKPGGTSLWIILAALLAFAGAAQRLDDPPAPLALDAPATQFSALRAAAQLHALLAEGVPHPLASPADARVRERIVARLAALGIPAQLQEGWVCDTAFACGRAVNIVAQLDGSEPASGAVLLAAHYDSVPAGPGAGDDGAGVASILEIARILKLQPPARHPVILLIDEGEETGLLGAKLFVDSHPLARTVKSVVNIDARGDSGPSLMFETGAATDSSMRLFAGSVARPKSNSLYFFIYKLLPNDTDFTVFKGAGYEGFNFALIGDVERYHTPQDSLANLDFGSLQHQGQNALAAVQALAAADVEKWPAAGAVFFDLFGRSLAHWPASWAPWIGCMLVAALLLALWRIRRRADIPAQGIVFGWAALACGWLCALLPAALLLALVRGTGAVPPAEAYGWTAHPLGMHIACVALALLAPLLAARVYARRTGPWGLWLANIALHAALAVLCSLRFPELSFLFVVPVTASLLGAAFVLRASHRVAGDAVLPSLAVALPVFGTAFAFLPSTLLMYTGLGADAWPIITAVCALIALGLAPLLVNAPSRHERALLLVSTVGVVAGVAVTLLQAPYSQQMPQRTLLWYALDADSHGARWILQPDSKSSPPQLGFGDSGAAPAAALPAGPISGVHVAAAPLLDYAAPELQVLAAQADADGVRYHLHLRSARGAPEIELALPPSFKVTSAAVLDGAQRLDVKVWRAPGGTGWLDLVGGPASGVDVELRVPDAKAHALHLLDRSYGLPPEGAALRPAGPALTTASQDGDLAIVYRSVTLAPDAAGAR